MMTYMAIAFLTGSVLLYMSAKSKADSPNPDINGDDIGLSILGGLFWPMFLTYFVGAQVMGALEEVSFKNPFAPKTSGKVKAPVSWPQPPKPENLVSEGDKPGEEYEPTLYFSDNEYLQKVEEWKERLEGMSPDDKDYKSLKKLVEFNQVERLEDRMREYIKFFSEIPYDIQLSDYYTEAELREIDRNMQGYVEFMTKKESSALNANQQIKELETAQRKAREELKRQLRDLADAGSR